MPRTHIVERSRQKAGLSLAELWLDYFALSGEANPLELDAFLHGAIELPSVEYDKVAHALNEHFVIRGQSHRVPYSQEL